MTTTFRSSISLRISSANCSYSCPGRTNSNTSPYWTILVCDAAAYSACGFLSKIVLSEACTGYTDCSTPASQAASQAQVACAVCGIYPYISLSFSSFSFRIRVRSSSVKSLVSLWKMLVKMRCRRDVAKTYSLSSA